MGDEKEEKRKGKARVRNRNNVVIDTLDFLFFQFFKITENVLCHTCMLHQSGTTCRMILVFL